MSVMWIQIVKILNDLCIRFNSYVVSSVIYVLQIKNYYLYRLDASDLIIFIFKLMFYLKYEQCFSYK